MVDLNVFMKNLASKCTVREDLYDHFAFGMARTPQSVVGNNSGKPQTPEEIDEEALRVHFKLQAELSAAAEKIKSKKSSAEEIEQRLASNYYEKQEEDVLAISRESLEQSERSDKDKKRMIMGQIRTFVNTESLMECFRVIEEQSYELDSCVDIFELLAKKKREYERPKDWLPFVEKVLTRLRTQSNFRKHRSDPPMSFYRVCQENLHSPIVRTIFIEELCKPGSKKSTPESRLGGTSFDFKDFMFVKEWLTKTPHSVCFPIISRIGDDLYINEMSMVLQQAILTDRIDYSHFRPSTYRCDQMFQLWHDYTLKKFMFNYPQHGDVVSFFPAEKSAIVKRRIAHNVYFEYVLPMLPLGLPPYVLCWIIELLVYNEHYPHFHGIKLIEKMRDVYNKILDRRVANKKKKFVIELSK